MHINLVPNNASIQKYKIKIVNIAYNLDITQYLTNENRAKDKTL